MAGETGQIRRDIESTRAEIDTHLQELSGQVRREVDIEAQARRNLPQVLLGAAIGGLFAGMLVGHGGRHYERDLAREEARLVRERRRLAKERGRLHGAMGVSEVESGGYDIP